MLGLKFLNFYLQVIDNCVYVHIKIQVKAYSKRQIKQLLYPPIDFLVKIIKMYMYKATTKTKNKEKE